jgi:hypothetical protein
LTQALADVEQAIAEIGDDPSLLDTRGYVHYLLGDLQSARTDLDQAVSGAEAQYQAGYGKQGLVRHRLIDQREFDMNRKEMERTVAVIRYHRALVLSKLNETKRTEQDLQRVKELGFQPGEELY